MVLLSASFERFSASCMEDFLTKCFTNSGKALVCSTVCPIVTSDINCSNVQRSFGSNKWKCLVELWLRSRGALYLGGNRLFIAWQDKSLVSICNSIIGNRLRNRFWILHNCAATMFGLWRTDQLAGSRSKDPGIIPSRLGEAWQRSGRSIYFGVAKGPPRQQGLRGQEPVLPGLENSVKRTGKHESEAF